MKAALQLWSIKDLTEENLEKTLEKVAKMGYQGVEFAGYFGHSSQEIKSWLDKFHLEVAASHIPLDHLRDDFEACVAFEKEIGNKNLVIPWINYETKEEWEEAFQTFNELAKRYEKEGFTFYYHNHAHEFREDFDALTAMMEKTSHLHFEVDTYWVAYAGVDVVTFMKAHQEKIGLIHLKDMTTVDGNKESIELGEGILPLKAYLQFAKENHIPWIVVEQEQFSHENPEKAASKNAHYLNALIKEVEQ